MSTFTAEEIEEKKRKALEKLKSRKINDGQQNKSATTQFQNSNSAGSSKNIMTSMKTTENFYKTNNISPKKSNKAEDFLKTFHQNKMTFNRSKNNRNSNHPYQGKSPKKRGNITTNSDPFEDNKKLASVFIRTVTCTCFLVPDNRFAVRLSEYHSKVIDTFKTIPSRSYDKDKNLWSFDIRHYDMVQERVGSMKPNIIIDNIPKNVLKICASPENQPDFSCLSSIEPKLVDKLLHFQKEGICFGISKLGRVLIADEMGLGKTYQALAIADFYRDDWPLLVCTSASTRDSWLTHIRNLLPNVACHHITLLNSKQDYIGDAKILITSYAMMEKNAEKLMEKKFGVIILDESQTLKNQKAKCTTVADRLSRIARRVILLSGTPALSRPVELFTQLQMLDRRFFSFMDYTKRYCDGKQTAFGWVSTGQSNLEELNIVLKKKFMIRRLKVDVLPQLAEKSRETIILDPALITKFYDETGDTLSILSESYSQSHGRDKEEILFKYFHLTAAVKIKAVCAYLKTLLQENIKFVTFAYHQNMIDAICSFLDEHKVDHIRIDGATKSDLRSAFIKRFQTKESCKVAVLAIKACNAGITLTAAQLIVFAELDWNPSTLAQAESRVHRIGQEGSVICRYLIASNTADDIIWSIVRNKQEVLNKAGIFSENIQDGEHILGPSSNHKIDKYIKKDSTPKKAKSKKAEEIIPMENDSNVGKSTKNDSTESNVQSDINSNSKSENFEDLLNDDEDDDFANLVF